MDAIAVNEVSAKSAYQAPVVSVIGTFEEITQAANGLAAIDGMYPAHTPLPNHTS